MLVLGTVFIAEAVGKQQPITVMLCVMGIGESTTTVIIPWIAVIIKLHMSILKNLDLLIFIKWNYLWRHFFILIPSVFGIIILVGTIILGRLLISRKWLRCQGQDTIPASQCFHTCSGIVITTWNKFYVKGWFSSIFKEQIMAYDISLLLLNNGGSKKIINTRHVKCRST